MIQTLMKNFHHWNLSRMSRITARMFLSKTISEESVHSTTGSSSMTSTPALNVERPETETVELETSGVQEYLIVTEEVSLPVATAEEVPCHPPPVAVTQEVPCKPVRSPTP